MSSHHIPAVEQHLVHNGCSGQRKHSFRVITEQHTTLVRPIPVPTLILNIRHNPRLNHRRPRLRHRPKGPLARQALLPPSKDGNGEPSTRTLVEDELKSGDVQVEDVSNASRPDECFSFVWDGLIVYEWESN